MFVFVVEYQPRKQRGTHMSRVTTRKISAAIEEATGDKGINVHVDYGMSYGHFYCDVASPLDGVRGEKMIHGLNKLSDYTIEEWVVEYKRVIADRY